MRRGPGSDTETSVNGKVSTHRVRSPWTFVWSLMHVHETMETLVPLPHVTTFRKVLPGSVPPISSRLWPVTDSTVRDTGLQGPVFSGVKVKRGSTVHPTVSWAETNTTSRFWYPKHHFFFFQATFRVVTAYKGVVPLALLRLDGVNTSLGLFVMEGRTEQHSKVVQVVPVRIVPDRVTDPISFTSESRVEEGTGVPGPTQDRRRIDRPGPAPQRLDSMSWT